MKMILTMKYADERTVKRLVEGERGNEYAVSMRLYVNGEAYEIQSKVYRLDRVLNVMRKIKRMIRRGYAVDDGIIVDIHVYNTDKRKNMYKEDKLLLSRHAVEELSTFILNLDKDEEQ